MDYVDFEDQEPLRDIYLKDGVYSLPSDSEFESKYSGTFTIESSKLINGWVKNANDKAKEKNKKIKQGEGYKVIQTRSLQTRSKIKRLKKGQVTN
jgi:hypothetical protein